MLSVRLQFLSERSDMAEHAEAMIAQCVLKNVNAESFNHRKRKFCQKSYYKLTYWPKSNKKIIIFARNSRAKC